MTEKERETDSLAVNKKTSFPLVAGFVSLKGQKPRRLGETITTFIDSYKNEHTMFVTINYLLNEKIK